MRFTIEWSTFPVSPHERKLRRQRRILEKALQRMARQGPIDPQAQEAQLLREVKSKLKGMD